jgi:hypothetical protein
MAFEQNDIWCFKNKWHSIKMTIGLLKVHMAFEQNDIWCFKNKRHFWHDSDGEKKVFFSTSTPERLRPSTPTRNSRSNFTVAASGLASSMLPAPPSWCQFYKPSFIRR